MYEYPRVSHESPPHHEDPSGALNLSINYRLQLLLTTSSHAHDCTLTHSYWQKSRKIAWLVGRHLERIELCGQV